MIEVSYLQNVYRKRETNALTLQRAHITAFGSYPDWPSFTAGFLIEATNPKPATNKGDAYGWCATLFAPSGKEDDVNSWNRGRAVIAHRAGEHAADALTLFFADLDNHKADQPRIDIDVVEAVLSGLALPHILYSSFSHTPEKHKVRIIIPITRWITPDEAFRVFLVFNHALQYQLDGSIYDPGDFLYGPPLGSDVRVCHEGSALDVDTFLALADELPPEAIAMVTRSVIDQNKRPPTTQELADYERRLASTEATEGVSIQNPRYFNPEWFADADSLYLGGSHWQTQIGLLTKAWLKSGRTLSRADLETIQRELDCHWFGYLGTHYSRSELARALKDAMKHVGSTPAFRPALNRAERFERATPTIPERWIKRKESAE